MRSAGQHMGLGAAVHTRPQWLCVSMCPCVFVSLQDRPCCALLPQASARPQRGPFVATVGSFQFLPTLTHHHLVINVFGIFRKIFTGVRNHCCFYQCRDVPLAGFTLVLKRFAKNWFHKVPKKSWRLKNSKSFLWWLIVFGLTKDNLCIDIYRTCIGMQMKMFSLRTNDSA